MRTKGPLQRRQDARNLPELFENVVNNPISTFPHRNQKCDDRPSVIWCEEARWPLVFESREEFPCGLGVRPVRAAQFKPEGSSAVACPAVHIALEHHAHVVQPQVTAAISKSGRGAEAAPYGEAVPNNLPKSRTRR